MRLEELAENIRVKLDRSIAMHRPQTLADVARKAREAPSEFYVALNEFADEVLPRSSE